MSSTPPDPSQRPRRRRLTPEKARRAILDAAGNRLTRDGPDGLRLQSIAADLGISHSSILHHFGSRDGLLDALSSDAFEALDRDLRASLESPPSGENRSAEILDRAARTLRDEGHAKLLVWQIMSGRLPRRDGDEDDAPPDEMLKRISEIVHASRIEDAAEDGIAPPDLEDTRFFVLMIAYSLFAEAIAGDVLAGSAGLAVAPDTHRRFRHWLARRGEALLLADTDDDDASGARGDP